MSYIALIENAISDYQLKYKKKPTHVLINEYSWLENWPKLYSLITNGLIPKEGEVICIPSSPIVIKDVFLVKTLDIPPYYIHCFTIEDNL